MSRTERETIRVEVAYARPEEQAVLALDVAAGCTVEEAIRASGILERFPEIDLGRQEVGIYGRQVALSAGLRDRDRVEIYRPLQVDPKEMRRQRARRQRR